MLVRERLLALAIYLVTRLWTATLRIRIVGDENQRAPEREGRPSLHVLWHQRLVLGILPYRGKDVVTMASRSADGEVIARFLTRWGFSVVRGSSSRGGGTALRELTEALRGTPRWAALTTDGPRGPARRSKPGALLVAGVANAALLPAGSSSTRPVFLKSWDRFLVPMPFSRCVLVIGEEVRRVPGERDEDFLARLDRAIDGATAEADALCGIEHAPRERVRQSATPEAA